MDNPIELAFLANGERFFTSTFLQNISVTPRMAIGPCRFRGSVFVQAASSDRLDCREPAGLMAHQ